MAFCHVPNGRELIFHMDNFLDGKAIDGHFLLTDEPEESMVICTPFDKPAHFYFNQKINCQRAAGEVVLGEETYTFEPTDSFGVLDWGRGVWTYHNTWYWGSASGQVDGVPFGWNIGYGFGDTSAASENMLFYNGKAHKLSQVKFNIPMKTEQRTICLPGHLPVTMDVLRWIFCRFWIVPPILTLRCLAAISIRYSVDLPARLF